MFNQFDDSSHDDLYFIVLDSVIAYMKHCGAPKDFSFEKFGTNGCELLKMLTSLIDHTADLETLLEDKEFKAETDEEFKKILQRVLEY